MLVGQNTNGQLDKPPTSNPIGKGWWKFILPLVLVLAVLGTLMVANNASAGVVTNPVGGQNPDQASGQAPASGQPQKSTSTNVQSTKLAPPAAPYVILYDQYDNAGANASVSQDFEPANDAFDAQLADDFVVPAGQTWTVTEVDAQGVYFNGFGPALSFNVFFYQDSSTLPATPVYTATGQSYTGSTDFVITLTTPAVLPAGTYWVSPQARMDFSAGGEWGWQDRTVQSNSPAAFRNPGGGFACPAGGAWAVKTSCIPTASGPDQVYRLVGTIGGGGATNTPTNTPIATATSCGISNPINEGFEGGLNTFSSVVGTCVPGGCGWTATGNPHTGSGSAFAPDLADVSDQYLELTNAISIPAGSTSATLSFWHAYDMENTYDGGVLEVSTDGGTTWVDVLAAGGSFISGGYDGTISSSFNSPIAGRQAWTGAFTTYRQVQVNLNSLIGQNNLKIRFREANDESVAHVGWNVDDVLLSVAGSCGSVTATPTGPTATATATVCGTGGTPGPWATATTGPALRYRAGGTTDGTYVYVYGGSNDVAAYLNDLWRWDPATETWTQLANMPTGKSNIQGAYYNGKIYVPGGYIGSHITENAIYDIATNTWTTGAALPAPQSGTTSAYNGKIYNIGGNPGPQATVSIYDIATNTWSTGASMPTATTYGRSITVGAYIYYVGGIAGTTTNAVYRYDIAADSWSTMAPLQTARTSEELMSTSDGSKIFAVMGGDASFFNGVPLAQTVEIYDVAGNTWTYGNPVVVTAAAPSGGGAGGKLMVQGGTDNANYFDTVQVSTVSGGGGCGTGTPVATATCAPGFIVVGPNAPATGNIPFKHTNTDTKLAANGSGAHGGTATVNLPFAPITFLLDDGTYENSVGWTDQSTNTEYGAIWLNRFTPPAGSYPITLNTVSIEWPVSPSDTLVGKQVRVLVYSDADGDGDPSNATLLDNQVVTIASLETFLDYTVNATITSGDIYVGFEDLWADPGYAPPLYSAAIDTNSSNLRSYVVANDDNSAPDYMTLSNNQEIGTIEDLSGGSITGNWLIRASGDTNVVSCVTNTPVPPTDTPVATDTPAATATCVPGFLVVGPSAPATGNIPFKQTAGKMSATGNGAHGGTATVNLPFAPITFLLDDGTYESSIGWNDMSTEFAAIWINRFTPPAGSYPITLNKVTIEWPQNASGTLVGLQARILVYSDADGDGDPSNATLLSSSLVTIASLDSFLDYTVNANITSGDIYVGFEDQWAESGYTPLLYPAAIDTGSTNNRSYVAAMSTGAPDYTNLGNNDNIGTIEELSGGAISGNWLIRTSGDTNVVPCATGTATVVPPTDTAVVTGTAVATDTPVAGSPTETPTACTLSFEDVPPDHTFYAYIQCLACRGIINGYPCGGPGEPCNGNNDPYFRPGNNVTRGQFSKIASNSAGFSDPPGAQQYEDVLPGSTFYDYIWRLTDRGLVNGYPCGGPGEPCGPNNLPYFRPNANVTRGQLSKIDANAAGLTQPPGAQQYEDVLPGSTFYDYIWRLTDLGIMNGYPCGGIGEPCGPNNLPYFRPGANATRGQASKIVANTFFPNCQVR